MTERMKEKGSRAQKALWPSSSGQQPKCYDRTPYGCPWCDLKFESKRRGDIHVVSSHKFNCNACLKEVRTWTEFLNHAKICEFSNKNVPFYDEYCENEE
jgi:hypothetical protein